MTDIEKHCEGCRHLKVDSCYYGYTGTFISYKCKAKSQRGTIVLQSVIERCDRENLKEQ